MCGILLVTYDAPNPALLWSGTGPTPSFDIAPRGEPPRFHSAWEAATKAIGPRGPDGWGGWIAPSGLARLYHTRLAVQDVSAAGAQPMTVARAGTRERPGEVAITFNGEIYNSPELRRELEGLGCVFRSSSDTEVLVRGYIAWGMTELLRRVVGMFAFAIWDDAERTLVAAVDPVGMKPLFFSEPTRRGRSGADDAALVLGSTADAVRLAAGDGATLDPVGVARVLTLGYSPGPGSVWRGVSKLMPGHTLEWRPGGRVRLKRYWSLPTGTHTDGDRGERFESTWPGVLADHLLSDIPVGVFLSSGIDSAAVAVGLADLGRLPSCFTMSMPDAAADEFPGAAALARHIGARHVRVEFDAGNAHSALFEAACVFDEPQGFTALLTAVRMARSAREHGAVMLAGDGGDEVFAGYTWHDARLSEATERLVNDRGLAAADRDLSITVGVADASGAARFHAMRAMSGRSFVHAHLSRVFAGFHPAEARALLPGLDVPADEGWHGHWLSGFDDPGLEFTARAQRLDFGGFLPWSILPKIDRAGMAVGLELRAPMLDRRIVEGMIRNGPGGVERDGTSRGVSGRASKAALRAYLSDRVPMGHLERPKQGFSLRMGDDRAWESLLGWVDGSALVRLGVLRKDYRSFLHVGERVCPTRLFTLCFLAAWAESRITA